MSDQNKLIEKPKMQLKKKGDFITYQYNDANPQEIIEDFESDYGIKPQKGFLAVYSKGGILTPYVQKAGWIAIGNHLKISTKIEMDKMGKVPGGPIFARVKVTAVSPSGVSHEAFGYSDSTEKGRDKMNKVISMATTRGRSNAIAMHVPARGCPNEDFTEEERRAAYDPFVKEVLYTCNKCKKEGWSKKENLSLGQYTQRSSGYVEATNGISSQTLAEGRTVASSDG